MKKFVLLALLAAFVVPVMAAETYCWNFSGTVTAAYAYPGVAAGDTLTGMFWVDTDSGDLLGLSSSVAGSSGNVDFTTDFAGAILVWDEAAPQISATLFGEYVIALTKTSYTQVINPNAGPFNGFGTFSADIALERCAVVPAPGAILLGVMGTGLAGWMRRRRAI